MSRYIHDDGRPVREVWGNDLMTATPQELLRAYRDFTGSAFPSLRMTRELVSTVELDTEQHQELVRLLRAGSEKCTHSVEKLSILETLRYFDGRSSRRDG